MCKESLLATIDLYCAMTRQNLKKNPKIAQEYLEKAEHLSRVMRMVSDFETMILQDLDVD